MSVATSSFMESGSSFQENPFIVILVMFAKALIPLVLVGWVYFHPMDTRNIVYLYVCCTSLYLLLASIPVAESPLLMSVVAAALGGLSGFNLLLNAVFFAYFSLLTARRGILAGLVLGCVLQYGVRVAGLDVAAFMQIGRLVCIVLAMLFLLVCGDSCKGFVAVRDVASRFKVKRPALFVLTSVPRKMLLVATFCMALFSFCYGVFMMYALAQGEARVAADVVLVATSLLALGLLVTNAFVVSRKYLDEYLTVISVVLALILLVVLVIAPYSPILFTVMGIGRLLLFTALIMLLTELSIEDGVSPVFRTGAYILVPTAAAGLGQMLSTALMAAAGPTAYFIPRVVSVLMALATIALMAGVVFAVDRRNRGLDADGEQPTVADALRGMVGAGAEKVVGDAANGSQAGVQADASVASREDFADFCARYGLSGRESEVIGFYAQGRGVAYIAGKLYLSEATVRSYIRQAYQKIGVHNKQGLFEAIDRAAAGGE